MQAVEGGNPVSAHRQKASHLPRLGCVRPGAVCVEGRKEGFLNVVTANRQPPPRGTPCGPRNSMCRDAGGVWVPEGFQRLRGPFTVFTGFRFLGGVNGMTNNHYDTPFKKGPRSRQRTLLPGPEPTSGTATEGAAVRPAAPAGQFPSPDAAEGR